ncbi:hypothetical protein MMC26_003740 [Xylographa opegraphella]|nr:hypothetical protein [Xylographa opegraphella]
MDTDDYVPLKTISLEPVEPGLRSLALSMTPPEKTLPAFNPGWRFYLAFVTLSIITLAAALDATTLSVALPIIAHDINGTAIEVFWAGTSFLLSSTVFQPILAMFSHISGRKPLVLVSLVLFTVGAIVAAVAQNFTVLLVGRSIQGIGGGGITVLSEIIVSDLVPLRHRGNWMGFLAMTWAIGSTAGPIVGGSLAQNLSWRWIFWINLPFTGVGFVMIILFLNLGFRRGKIMAQLARVDWIGLFLFITSTTFFMIPITWGGVMYAWSSWQTLLPLILGGAGLVCFVLYENYIAAEPLLRLSIFGNWTARVTYLQTVIHGMILWSIVYFLPLYYEAVKGYTPIVAGLGAFPESLTVAPASVATGIAIAITGRYRWSVWAGWLLTTVGCGLLCLLDVDTSVAGWIFLNIVPGLGTGILFSAMNFSLQASSRNQDIAFAIAFFAFFRSFGQTLGIAVGGVIFQNRIRTELLTYPLLAAHAVEYAQEASSLVQVIRAMADGLPQKALLIQAYADSLKTIWMVMCALSAVALLSSAFVEGYSLDVAHETEQRFEERKKKAAGRGSRGGAKI